MENDKKKNSLVSKILRYTFGGTLVLGSLTDLPSLYSIMGMIAGLSLMPFVYDLTKINFDNKKTKLIPIAVPILSMILWGASLPHGESLETDNKKQSNDVQQKVNNKKNDNKKEKEQVVEKLIKEPVILICDGTNITENCELDGIMYSIYKYHPAVSEKSHIEKVTTYKKKIVGYCTKCKDGTYSPSCATGRGACSHHGGVAQWNAPIYNNVPETKDKKVIDSPAIPERYEKVIKKD